MSKEMIDNIVNDFFPRISAIQLGGTDLGEQMLSPHFEYFLRKVGEYPINLEMITNASLIKKHNANILAGKMSVIHLSIEGIGATFKNIRGYMWESFVQKVDLLCEARSRCNNDRSLKIYLDVCVFREWYDDYFALLEFAKEKGIDVLDFRQFLPLIPTERKSSPLYFEEESNLFFNKLEQRAKELNVFICCPPKIPFNKSERNIFNRIKCSLPYEVFGVQVDGKVITCCTSRFDLGYYIPGYDNTMKRWLSQEFVNLRETVNSKNPCKTCLHCEVPSLNPLAFRPVFKKRDIFKRSVRSVIPAYVRNSIKYVISKD